MHDKNGTLLKKGDIVNVPCVIDSLDATENCCNVCLVSVHGRRPDGVKEKIHAANTGICVLVERGQNNT